MGRKVRLAHNSYGVMYISTPCNWQIVYGSHHFLF